MTNPTPSGVEALIKHMVKRFLSWRLPSNFDPDNGISYTRPNYAPELDATPTGTNLFNTTQAEAMVRHMLVCAPFAALEQGEGRKDVHERNLTMSNAELIEQALAHPPVSPTPSAGARWTEEQITDVVMTYEQEMIDRGYRARCVADKAAIPAMRAALATLNAAPDAGRKLPGREEIARIIDPWPFENWQMLYDYGISRGESDAEARRAPDTFHGEQCEAALAKADAILAPLSAKEGGAS